jgi:hypothetical protein
MAAQPDFDAIGNVPVAVNHDLPAVVDHPPQQEAAAAPRDQGAEVKDSAVAASNIRVNVDLLENLGADP